MAVWPATLPQYVLVDGYQERPPELLIESPMDAGPPARRRRFTAGETAIACRIALSAAQKATLEGFFGDDLKAGAVAFDWVHPVSREPATVRMRRPGFTAEPGGVSFIASIELLVQP
jgi:hypothetical protein